MEQGKIEKVSPFARTYCRYPGCNTDGSVPGIKRHSQSKHPGFKQSYEPGERPASQPLVSLAEMKSEELRRLGKEAGIKGAGHMKKEELLAALGLKA